MKSKLLKHSVLVSAGELGVKAIGYIRDAVLAAIFSNSAVLDAFFIALNVPYIFISIFGNALTTAFIPFFSLYGENTTTKEQHFFLAKVTTCILISFLFLAAIVFLFPGMLVAIMAPGFSGDQAEYTANLVRILSLLTLFTGVAAFLSASAQCKERYNWLVLASIANNVFVLLLVLCLGPKLGIVGVVYAFILGAAVQVSLLALRYYLDGGRLTCKVSFFEPGIQDVLRVSWPLYVGMLAAKIATVVDRAMASGLPAGSISALAFADKIRNLPITVFSAVMITVLFPKLSQLVASKQNKELSDMLDQNIKIALVLCLYIVNIIWLLALPITSIFFEHGNFTRDAAVMTAEALKYFSIGIPWVVMGTLVLRVYHAHQDTKTPVLIGFVNVIINIILNLVFIGPLAHQGIALATSIASFVWFFLLLYVMYFRLKVPLMKPGRSSMKFIIKLLAISFVVFITDKLLLELLQGRIYELFLIISVTLISTVSWVIGLKMCRMTSIFVVKKVVNTTD